MRHSPWNFTFLIRKRSFLSVRATVGQPFVSHHFLRNSYLPIKHKILYRYRYMFQTYLQLQNFMIKNNIYYY